LRPRHVALAVLALAVAAYAPTLWNGFTWDDEYVVVRNPAIRALDAAPQFFTDGGTAASYDGLVVYRPLRSVALALIYRAGGLAPFGYHLANLLLHLANVALVLAVARRLLGDGRAALLVAALFAVHPIGSEAVAGAVGIGDLLSAAFLLAAFRAFLALEELDRREAGRVVAVALLFLGAVLSKETAIVFPFLAAAHELVLRPGRAPRPRVLALLAGLVAVAVAAFVARTIAIGGLNAGKWEGITFGRTMLMQADVVARYLRLVAFPVGLSARHAIPVPVSLLEPRNLASVAALGAVANLGALSLRRAPAVAFGIAWFFVGLLPVMNLVPLPGAMMGERFLYVPAIGLFIAAADVGRRALAAARPPWTAVAVPVVVAWLVGLSGATFARCLEWHDNLTLFEAALRVAPTSNAVRLNLVREYQAIGREDLAREQTVAAIENTRAYAECYLEIGRRTEEANDHGVAEDWYRRVLLLAPDDPRAREGLAWIDRKRRRRTGSLLRVRAGAARAGGEPPRARFRSLPGRPRRRTGPEKEAPACATYRTGGESRAAAARASAAPSRSPRASSASARSYAAS
jgi:hypothetical protein